MEHSLYNPIVRQGDYQMQVELFYFRDFFASVPAHHHNQIEIMYVIDGQCQVAVPDTVHTLRRADFILLDANIHHRMMIESKKSGRLLNVEFSFVDKQSSSVSIRELLGESADFAAMLELEQPYYLLKDPDEVYPTLRSLIGELNKDCSGRDLMVQMFLMQLLVKIARLVGEQSEQIPERHNRHVKRALAFIQQNYDKDIQVNDIAEHAGVHPSHLHRTFQSTLGCTPIQYITRFRIETAKLLLSKTDLEIVDICCYVGINSRQYFSFLFKRQTGLTAKEYRLRNRSIQS